MKLPVPPTAARRLHSVLAGGGPAPSFRRQSWIEIQRALDPLGRPRQLRGAERVSTGDE